MSNKIRVDFNPEELRMLIRSVQASKPKAKTQHTDLSDLLSKKYINKLDPAKSAKLVQLSYRGSAQLIDPDLMKVIVHGLSILTGAPENQILPNTGLADLGMTDLKNEQIRKHLNKYIGQRGGSKFISGSEMDEVEKVQDIYDLASEKLS